VAAICVHTGELDRAYMEAMLGRHHVARIAFAFHDRVVLTLVNYVYASDWVYARIEAGAGLTTLQHHQWASLAVDEIDGVYDWRSVTVHGSVQLLSADDTPGASSELAKALGLLRTVVPAVFTADDPMPERAQIFRLHVNEIVGSESRSTGADRLPPA
jgi:nitroimidazol reductase NimA-like FMN-containing flavoprotein (pyridoxamine 5'-phosphate oxidase superfamily)